MQINRTKKKDGSTVIRCNIRNMITGHVRIENGDTVIEGKNKITNNLVLSLANFISSSRAADTDTLCMNRGYTSTTYVWIYLGEDTTTPTTASTTNLVSAIGPTKCSSITSTGRTDGNNYYIQWMGTFNPGTVSGTVGEMGLYMRGKANQLEAAGTNYANNATYMQARFSVADGEFAAFTIDETKPVVISWTLKFTSDGIFTNYMVRAIANAVGASSNSAAINLPTYGWASKTTYMVIGTDTITLNTPTDTALGSPIGTPPGTKPTMQSFSTTLIDTGEYKMTLTGQWAAGTVSGTVGEIGLYLYGDGALRVPSAPSYGLYFAARLSAADEHFDSFAIDTGKNLIIIWDIYVTFQT